MIASRFSMRILALPAPAIYVAAGATFGVLAGACGAVVVLALLLGHPVGLVLLLGMALVGSWRAARRHQAAGLAWCFALSLGLAQWPFTAWHAGRLLAASAGHDVGSVLFAALAGLACAPGVIAMGRATSADLRE